MSPQPNLNYFYRFHESSICSLVKFTYNPAAVVREGDFLVKIPGDHSGKRALFENGHYFEVFVKNGTSTLRSAGGNSGRRDWLAPEEMFRGATGFGLFEAPCIP